MRTLLQRLDDGETLLEDVPVPTCGGSHIVVRSEASVISVGTEKMLVEFGKSGLLSKARANPERVRQVVDKMRTDGIVSTLGAVKDKLQAPIQLGYCNAGTVVEVGDRVSGFHVGDRVVTNGSHSEYVRVPPTLAAVIPSGVSAESAAFTPLAAIALQGIRLARPTIGETFVVYGLGLIGQLAVQLLRAGGCRVVGIDIDRKRLELAGRFGAHVVDGRVEDVCAAVMALTVGVGADAVLMTLSSRSDEPIRNAATMSRKKGRIVLTGVTGLQLSREDFYEKEISFTVSCSYGPGRYDPEYETRGKDYPIGYVRWTEQRNFQAVLNLMAEGSVNVTDLITHRFEFSQAPAAYSLIAGETDALGVVLQYPEAETDVVAPQDRVLVFRGKSERTTERTAAVLGAGNFAMRTFLPILKSTGWRLRTIISRSGTEAAIAARKFGFETAGSEPDAVFEDESVASIFVLTRHDTHAEMVIRSLESGKHVFVEKPLATTMEDLDRIGKALSRSKAMLMVGFNRRFAPHAVALKALLDARSGPASLIITVNAGQIPQSHWVQDAHEGGGRIIGEGCHFIDLAFFLLGHAVTGVEVSNARGRDGRKIEDQANLVISFGDGSVAVVHYLACGARSYPKERVEAFFDGKTIVLDNWRTMKGYSIKLPRLRAGRQDKGHRAEVVAWGESITSGVSPIPAGDLLDVSRWAIEAGNAARI